MKKVFTKLIVWCFWAGEITTLGASNIFSNTTRLPTTAPEVRDEYFRLLESIADQPPESQTSRLKLFIESYPAFEAAYAKLLERFLLHEDLLAAQEYFFNLANHRQFQRNSLWMLARIYTYQNDIESAVWAYRQALKAGPLSIELIKDFIEFEHLQHKENSGWENFANSSLDYQERQWVSACIDFEKENYHKAIKACQNIPEKIRRHPLVLDLLGRCYLMSSQYTQADSSWRLGLKIARKMRDLKLETQFLLNLGDLEWKKHDSGGALSLYESAHVIAKRIDDINLRQLIEGRMGNFSYMHGDYGKAGKQYEYAIELATKMGTEISLVEWYKNYAQVLFEKGDLVESFNALEASEALAEKINNKASLIDLKIRKGYYYTFLNQRAYAQEIFEQAYDMASALDLSKEKNRAQVNLGNLIEQNGNYGKARKFYFEYIRYLKQNGSELETAYWIGRIAATYMLEKRYELAQKYYLKAYETAKKAQSKSYTAWYLLKIADLDLINGKLNQAIEKYNKVLVTATEDNNVNMIWWVFVGLGNSYWKNGDIRTAITHYLHAAKVIENSRKSLGVQQLRTGFFSERYSVFEKLASCYSELYEKEHKSSTLDSLFYFAELSRSRSLKDVLGRNSVGRKNAGYARACEQLRILQRQLRWVSNEPYSDKDLLENQLLQIEKARYTLLTQSLRLNNGRRDSTENLPGFSSIQTVLEHLKRQNAGALLYQISEERSFVLVADKSQVKIINLAVTRAMVDSLIGSLMSPFHNVQEYSLQRIPFKATIAHELYQILLKPVEEQVKLSEKLIIIPDLELLNLPFELLLIKQPDKPVYLPTDLPSYAENFLVHRYSFVYTPSITILTDATGSTPDAAKVAIFANPFGDIKSQSYQVNPQFTLRTGWRFDPLVFSETEAEGIKEVCPNTKVFARDEATKSRFFKEVAQFQVLHFATHAFADTTFDAFSGLVMAMEPDSTDDGLLMGYEISDLNLNCNLVTLSACETGRGRLVAGEGVLGLPRLFLGAGAKTVLMTHWKVDDKFTAQLMPGFYRYYLKQGYSKTEALANVKRDILNNSQKDRGVYYQHPFYWAAFALYGHPGVELSKEVSWASVAAASVVAIAILFIVFYNRKLIIELNKF